MFRVGLNPYGLAYTVGLQGAGTPRANPHAIGLDGFIRVAREIGAKCIELDGAWLAPMTGDDLARLREELTALEMTPLYSHGLTHTPGETLTESIRAATGIGAGTIRLHLTPVLEGARATWGPRWGEFVKHARATLKQEAPKAARAGLALVIEDHQDFGSDELVAMAEEAGENVGVVLDTGNPFAVGEDPVAFTRRVAHMVRHVHLKDYVAQFTDEGYRLVRCPIGDGCVPYAEIAATLAGASVRGPITASIEIGALEARHIRLLTPDWWQGYSPRPASELAIALGRLRKNRLDERADFRTPWERESPGPALASYEMAQIRRSVEHLRALGWM